MSFPVLFPIQALRTSLAILTLSLLAGCLGTDDIEVAQDSGEQQIYQEAQRYLQVQNWDFAVRALQTLESRYPFGRYAEQAQLELIYAHHGGYEYEAAIEAADRFIRLHPQHPSVDYAYYMKGVSAFDIEGNFLSRLSPTDKTKRDTGQVREAFAEFAQLLARFPDSPYAADARARMVAMRNMIARHEIHVANYYFRRGAWMAALNRGRYVVEHMQGTPAVADGLAVMTQSYLLLGYDELAADSARVLCENFPQHPHLDENCAFSDGYTAENIERSFLNTVSFGLIDPPKPPQFDYRPTQLN